MQSQNEFYLQPDLLESFTGRSVTLNPGKRRWTTTWTGMNPHCNWDDIFGVKSTFNFVTCSVARMHYHSVGLQPLCNQSSNMAWITCIKHKYCPKVSGNSTWIFLRVHPIIHEYSNSSTLFWHKHAITKWISSATRFARKLHWKECNPKPWQKRWTTTWTGMNPHCNWDDIFGVKSTSNFF